MDVANNHRLAWPDNTVAVRWTDDPPPIPTYADRYWWFANRWAEHLAYWLRFCGMY